MKPIKVLLQFFIVALLVAACAPSTPTAEPTEVSASPTASVGKVTDYSIKIEQEQGSGDMCGANATYFVTATIAADGVVAASYEVSSASSGGQIPTGGNFQDLTTNALSQSVAAGLTFDKPETKTLTWRLAGPYSYPTDITVKLRVNGGEFKSATVDCGSASAQSTATTAPAAAGGCKDSALYVSDDGKDGTVYAPNTAFKKTWKIRNTGTCTWDGNYMIYKVSGPTMTQQPAYLILPQGGQVAPGADVDISVDLLSPSNSGDYRSDWELRNGAGVSLIQFFLTLKVKDQSSGGGNSAGTIANVAPQIVLEQGSGAACTNNSTYFVYVDITSNGDATGNYRIDLTDGSGQVTNGTFDSGSPEETGVLFLRSGESQRVSLHIVGPYGYPDSVTVRVYVNDQSFGSVTASCQ